MKNDSNEDHKIALISYLSKDDRWIIDSGFIHHMIGDKSKFETIEHYKGSFIKFGNDASCLVKGKGSIRLIDRIICDNSYWVEGLNYNFFSVA